MLRLTPDIRNLVFDQLEIWDLYALTCTCKYLRNEVKSHGALAACNRIRRMPVRTKQFVANHTRTNLISKSYSPELLLSTALHQQILSDARKCSGHALTITEGAIRGHNHGFEVILLGRWVEPPPGCEEPSFLIRYFTLYDRVYIRFSLGNYTHVPISIDSKWLTAENLLDRVGVYAYAILHAASRTGAGLRFAFAPCFPEAAEPILHEIKAFEARHQENMSDPYNLTDGGAPPLTGGDPILDPREQSSVYSAIMY